MVTYQWIDVMQSMLKSCIFECLALLDDVFTWRWMHRGFQVSEIPRRHLETLYSVKHNRIPLHLMFAIICNFCFCLLRKARHNIPPPCRLSPIFCLINWNMSDAQSRVLDIEILKTQAACYFSSVILFQPGCQWLHRWQHLSFAKITMYCGIVPFCLPNCTPLPCSPNHTTTGTASSTAAPHRSPLPAPRGSGRN